MQQLINIIIVFVIIVSILKRIREVGETRGNLGKPSPPKQPQAPSIPGPVPPLTQTPLPAEEIPPLIPAMPAPVFEAPSVGEMMEPEGETVYHAPEIPSLRPAYETPFSENAWEQTNQDIEDRIRQNQEAYLRSLEQMSAPAVSARRPSRPVALRLPFTSDALVNGIIMSEILGPPKSLREDRW